MARLFQTSMLAAAMSLPCSWMGACSQEAGSSAPPPVAAGADPVRSDAPAAGAGALAPPAVTDAMAPGSGGASVAAGAAGAGPAPGEPDTLPEDAAETPVEPGCGFEVQELLDAPLAAAPVLGVPARRYDVATRGVRTRFAFEGAGCDEVVRLAELTPDGFTELPSVAADAGACERPAAPRLAAAGAGFQLVFRDPGDTEGGLLRVVDDAAPVALEATAGAASHAMSGLDDRVLLSWADGSEEGGTLRLRQIDAPPPVEDAVLTAPGALASEPVLLDLDGRGAMLAWVDHGEERHGIWARALDRDGSPLSEPVLLSGFVGAASSVDLAMRGDGVVAVYSIAIDGIYRVRMRQLRRDAGSVGSERDVVARPAQALDASVATLSPSVVAIAYRSPPDADEAGWTVRLSFVDRAGRVSGDHVLAQTVPNGGRLTVRADTSGTLSLAWVEDAIGQASLRLLGARLRCGESAP